MNYLTGPECVMAGSALVNYTVSRTQVSSFRPPLASRLNQLVVDSIHMLAVGLKIWT